MDRKEKSDRRWRGIDNTGKIFPATSNRRDTRVFRLYSVLKEKINPVLLQQALDRTMERYPMFLSVIRKGFFWYYFEKCDIKPEVHIEDKVPCSNIYIRDKKCLLFEVTYWENRINFEVFHALTDGTGAVEFIRELTKNYLVIAHADEGIEDVMLRKEDVTDNDFESDSFDKYFEKNGHKPTEKAPKTYQIHESKCEIGTMNLFQKIYSTKEIVVKAKELGVSVTVFLTSVLMCAINEERRTRFTRPIGIMIPVNLRKYFRSDTMMNFFGWISPVHDFRQDGEQLTDVTKSVKESFSRELTQERVASRMNKLVKIEKNLFLRGIPLELKIISMRLAATMSTDEITAVYSNVGTITMPEEYQHYIERFGFFVSTSNVQLCTCSFGDEFTVSFTSAYENENIQRNFVRILKENGIVSKEKEIEYPEHVQTPYRGLMFVKIFSFVMIAISVITVLVNRLSSSSIHWSTYAVLGAFCAWVLSTIGYFKRRNLMKNALWQQIIVTIICIVWDIFTGFDGWSLSIAIPIVNLTTIISMAVITAIFQYKIKDYIIYYMLSLLIGMLPIFLLLFHLIAFPMFIEIELCINFLLIVAIIIFWWKDLKSEIFRKFHV